MGIKKKLGMGVMAGALGLSLVGGGTYAAFTDTEGTSDSYAAGLLDLQLVENDKTTDLEGSLFKTNLQDFKPGDSITKEMRVKNNGTLSIKDVVVKGTYSGFADAGGNLNSDDDLGGWNSDNDFAKQIHVLIKDKDGMPVYDDTLARLNNASLASDDITGSTSNGSLPAIPAPGDTDPVTITLTFNENAGNEFMEDEMDINFEFIATQFDGTDFNDGDDVTELNGSETEE